MHNQSQINSNYFQNLDTISGMKELSDEAAATCSGGVEDVVLFDKPDFDRTGAALAVDRNISDLGNFNFDDKTSAIDINKGTWECFPQKNFQDGQGPSDKITLKPGRYDKQQLEKLGLKDNTLSSLRRKTA